MNAGNQAIVRRDDPLGTDLVALPDEVTFDGIAKRIRTDQMNSLDKFALARLQTKALVAQRKQQFSAALQVSQIATDAHVNMAARTVALYRDKFETEIRGAYVDMTAALGQRVEMAQIESMTSFGQKLTDFQQQLDRKNIAPDFKQRVLLNVQTAFNRLYDKLERMTEEIIVSGIAKG